jgi:MscS family membrane protein
MNWSSQIFLNNRISHLVIVTAIILLVWICRKWLSGRIASLLFIPIQKRWQSVDKKSFTGLIISPLGNLLMMLIAYLSIENLTYPDAWNIALNDIMLHQILIGISKCFIIIFFIRFINRFIDFIALVLDKHAKQNEDKSDDQLIVFFRDFLKAVFYILGFLMILHAGFKVNVGSVLTGLSIVGAALALAAKESIENLIASFIIFFDKPFFTGDFVRISNSNQTSGTIENIGLRSTRIRTQDHTLITVPNKQMVDSIVDNWSLRNARRTEINIELDIQNTSEKIQTLIQELKSFLSKKSEISECAVHLFELHKNYLIVKVECLSPSASNEEYLLLKEEINWQVKDILDKLNLKSATQSQEVVIIPNVTTS